MQIKTKTIRDLETIEKELNSISSGVLALPSEENFLQIATNFIYHNKNIYFFVRNKEVFKDIKFETLAKFTAITESVKGRNSKKSKENIYTLFYISVSGIIKSVKEKKLKSNIKHSFIQKYSGKLIESESKSKSFSRLVFIDSEELIATEETGL